MTRYALLALDLDGTTVDRHGRLGEKTKAALSRARTQGVRICFATGRRDADMHAFWQDTCYADYLLLNNGGKLVRCRDKKVLADRCIEKNAARELIQTALDHNWQLHVLADDFWAVNKWNDSLSSYATALGREPLLYTELEQLPWRSVEGFTATMDREPFCRYVRDWGLPIDCTLSEEGCMDMMAAGVSKWSGLEGLLSMLGIQPKEVVAAGDYPNDLPMICAAGVGVAVANALDIVKAEADYVTHNDCDHDAVAEIIERFLL